MLMLPPIQRSGAAARGRAKPEKAKKAEAAPRAETPRVEPADESAAANGPTEQPQKADARRGGRSWAGRSYAPLVAQLIAGALGVGQTRVRRRAAVAEALAAYSWPRDRPKGDRGVA